MITSLKSTARAYISPHPLAKFEQFVAKKGTLADYVRRFGMMKGLKNYFNCRIRRGGRVQVYYNRSEKMCCLRSGSADVMVFEQVFIFDDYDIEFKTDPEFIIDAGAHIGLASLYFSSRFPNAQIISLEPETENFNMLKENVKHQANVNPVNCALWHFSGEIYLDNPGANTWAFRVSEDHSDTAVATVDIATLLHQNKKTNVSILKIDIEGAEKSLFENATQWVEQIDYLVIETHDHIQSGASESVEKAVANDMKLVNHQGENWVYERNGLSG